MAAPTDHSKIKDLDIKAPGDADDEFIINDVTNGNVDKKLGMDQIRLISSQVTDFTATVVSSKLDDFSSTDDNTDTDATTSAHGLMSKVDKVKMDALGAGADMVLADAQTVTGAKTFEDTKLLLRNVADSFNGSFVNTNTADRIYTLPDATGGIPLLNITNTFTVSQILSTSGSIAINLLSDAASTIAAVSYANSNKSAINLARARGNRSAATDVASGDILGDINFQGFGSSLFNTVGRIRAIVNGAPSGGNIPTDLIFSVNDGSSFVEALRITKDKTLKILGTFDANSQTIENFVYDEDGTGNVITNLDIASIKAASSLLEAAIPFIIDGGGSAITTGVKGYVEVPFDCTIKSVRLLADQSGSIVIDIWKDTYANYPPVDADSITASAVPTISTAIKSEDSTLTGWTTTLSKGDIIGFNVDSVTTHQRVTISLLVDRT